MISEWCLVVTPEVDQLCPQRYDDRDECGQPALQAARCPDAEEAPHQESEIEAPEQALQDVRVPPQMRAAHPTVL